MRREALRIAFLEARDGKVSACLWVHRTLRLYRTALKTAYGHTYRRSLIESYLDFRQYLREPF